MSRIARIYLLLLAVAIAGATIDRALAPPTHIESHCAWADFGNGPELHCGATSR